MIFLPSIYHMRNMRNYFLTILCTCLENVLNFIHVNIHLDFWSFLYICSNFQMSKFLHTQTKKGLATYSLVGTMLKLVRTLLNYRYRVLGTSAAAIFLSNDNSLSAPIKYLEWTSCLISFELDQSTCQERIESDKIQNEKFLQWDSKRQPWDLKSDALPTKLAKLVYSNPRENFLCLKYLLYAIEVLLNIYQEYVSNIQGFRWWIYRKNIERYR